MKILENQAEVKAVEEAKREEEAKKIEQATSLEAQNRHQFFDLDNSVAASHFKGRRLKVIVKVYSTSTCGPPSHLFFLSFSSGCQLRLAPWSGLRGDLAHGRHGTYFNRL